MARHLSHVDYKLLRSEGYEHLSELVTDHLKKGYLPLGAPFKEGNYFFQAVYKL